MESATGVPLGTGIAAQALNFTKMAPLSEKLVIVSTRPALEMPAAAEQLGRKGE